MTGFCRRRRGDDYGKAYDSEIEEDSSSRSDHDEEPEYDMTDIDLRPWLEMDWAADITKNRKPPSFETWGKDIKVVSSFLKQRHGDFLSLRWDDSQGRHLTTRRTIAPGETVLVDRPLFLVGGSRDADTELWRRIERFCVRRKLSNGPLWYFAAMSAAVGSADVEMVKTQEASTVPQMDMEDVVADEAKRSRKIGLADELIACLRPPTAAAAQRMKMLFRPKEDSGQATKVSENVLALLGDLCLLGILDAAAVEEYFQMFAQNAFAVPADEQGAVGVYFAPSFIAHSCMPNSTWRIDEHGHFTLEAQARVLAGGTLTISYLGTDDMHLPAYDRRLMLAKSKNFYCLCPRCRSNDAVQPHTCALCGAILLYSEQGVAVEKQSIFRRLFVSSLTHAYVIGHTLLCATKY